MLRSTFAAYNEAHPDKPLVNPRNGAAGTLRQKDARGRSTGAAARSSPSTSTAAGRHRPRGGAARSSAPDAATWSTRPADEAVAAIRAIEESRGDSTPTSTARSCGSPTREAYAAAGARAEQPARRARVQVPGRGEDDRPARRRSGTSARSARSRRSRSSSRSSSAARPSRARRSPTRRSSARATCASATPSSCAARGDVIPFVAGVLDASKRTGEEREIEPPTAVPVVRQRARGAAATASELCCTSLAVPGAGGAPADPLGLARGGRHRGASARLDRAARRGRRARAARRLLRADARAAARLRAHRRRSAPTAWSTRSRRSRRRRAAPRADRPRDPDGLRGQRPSACAAPASSARGDRGRRRRGARRGRGHRAEGRGVAARVLRPRRGARGDRPRCASAASTSTSATRTARPRSPPTRRWPGKTVVVTGSIADPRSGEKIPRPGVPAAGASGPARRPRPRCRRHGHADLRRGRRRGEDRQGGEARRRGGRPGGGLEAADRGGDRVGLVAAARARRRPRPTRLTPPAAARPPAPAPTAPWRSRGRSATGRRR